MAVEKAPQDDDQTIDPGELDDALRESGLQSLEKESKGRDRIAKARAERIQLMRTKDDDLKKQKKEKEGEPISAEERMRRMYILLRSGAYDDKRLQRMLSAPGDTVKVDTTIDQKGEDGEYITKSEPISKAEIETWVTSLLPHERQRLYVLGRKKIDFKITWKAYEKSLKKNEIATKEGFQKYKEFQEGQKELADALEIVALPMLRAVFKKLGKNVEIYLTAANDDIAGGLDVAIEFLDDNGEPKKFHDGKPMRVVVDMTYARMKEKAKIDLDRNRISQEAYDILKGDDENVPQPLSNARAMKLFRTLVETLGGNMSTQTFDQKGPLKEPQEHIPRLIIGLEWKNAFAQISNWVEMGNEFEDWFKELNFSQRIAESIKTQLQGLHALAQLEGGNENTPYLADLMRELGLKEGVWKKVDKYDMSLLNIDNLLAASGAELEEGEERRKPEIWKERFYKAALAQIEHDKKFGGHTRGDIIGPVRRVEEKVQDPVEARKQQLRREIAELKKELLRYEIAELKRQLGES